MTFFVHETNDIRPHFGKGYRAVGTRKKWAADQRSLRTPAVEKINLCRRPQTCLVRGKV